MRAACRRFRIRAERGTSRGRHHEVSSGEKIWLIDRPRSARSQSGGKSHALQSVPCPKLRRAIKPLLNLEHRENCESKAIHHQTRDQTHRHDEAGMFPNDSSRYHPQPALFLVTLNWPFELHRSDLFRCLARINCRFANCVHKPCSWSPLPINHGNTGYAIPL